MANMTTKDRIQLAHWIRGNATPSEVLAIPRIGLVGNERFTPAAVRAFMLIWCWSADRMGGGIGKRQEDLWKRHGQAFLDRRYARCMSLVRRHIRG